LGSLTSINYSFYDFLLIFSAPDGRRPERSFWLNTMHFKLHLTSPVSDVAPSIGEAQCG
jgi:hypothetical protein